MQNHLKNQTSPYLLQHAENPVNWYPWCKEAFERARKSLLDSADEIVEVLSKQPSSRGEVDEQLIENAVRLYKKIFDEKYGGFGDAPKFPTPHNLLFLMNYYEKSKDQGAMQMVEKTLLQMYRGGMFDHIGWGFSRYSTDRYFLAPHFEKMLYDNALLILAYCKAYQITHNPMYRNIAEKTAMYVLREMTSKEGGFYSAQDADSEGVEGKYYLFEPTEIIRILGENVGKEFNQHYNITETGNFEGKNIPNLLHNENLDDRFTEWLPKLYEYRKKRYSLHMDDKILTSWNALMIASMCNLYRVSNQIVYLEAAKKAQQFICDKLLEGNTLYVSYREGKRSEKGFLDDYANEIFALISLYEATLERKYLDMACAFCDKVLAEFQDQKKGGFFLYGKENEQLILKPKETYDGAVPSGNSFMAYNLVRLHYLTGDEKYKALERQQLAFMTAQAERYPSGYAMFLVALSEFLDAPDKITIVLQGKENLSELPRRIALGTVVRILEESTEEYSLKNDMTTFYVCQGRSCQPPTNKL